MIRYYVDEDLFILEVSHSRMSPDNRDNPGSPGDPNESPGYDITLIELPTSPAPLPPSPLAPSAHAHTHAHVHAHVHESASS